MSADTTTGEESPGNDNPTAAHIDLKDYLEERAELAVEVEEVEKPDGSTRLEPVARTPDGDVAGVADFPSGKSNEGSGNFSKRTFGRFRSVVLNFLESQDVEDFDNVTPSEITRWNQQMQRDDLARTTRDKRLETLGVFVKWLEAEWRIETDRKRTLSDAVARKRDRLGVSGEEFSRAGDDDHRIPEERAEKIIGHLAEFDYASRKMVEFLLIYHVGFRQSGLRSVDCDDVLPRDGIIEVRNRPAETGLRLKRGKKGERNINVSDGVMRVVRDYINSERKEPKDGSDALLTSAQGRITKTTLYRDITALTACGECGFSRRNKYKCPESIGPHDLRRVAITRMRDRGMTWETIGGRVNAKPETLKKHYDSPTREEAAKRRREEVLNAL